MTAIEILETRRPEIEALCAKYGVSRLRLFGSSVRDDWNPESSDFDFLAEFGPPPEGIKYWSQPYAFGYELEELLGRHVDVVDWKAARKPEFRHAASAEAKEWYAA